MDRESLEALIEHQVADLRASFPHIAACRTCIESLNEGGTRRYCVRLDIRWPEHQSLISGKAKDGPHAAVCAAFEQARRRLEELKGRFA